MSASEILKRLDGEMTAGPWVVSALTNIYGDRGDGVRDILLAQANWTREDAQVVTTLRNALPELITVIQALERYDKAQEAGFGHVEPIHHALTALARRLEAE